MPPVPFIGENVAAQFDGRILLDRRGQRATLAAEKTAPRLSNSLWLPDATLPRRSSHAVASGADGGRSLGAISDSMET